MANRYLNFLQSNREKLLLLGYFFVVTILSVPLAPMLGTGWKRAEFSKDLLRLRSFLGITLAQVAVLLLGVFLGLLVLMTLDQKKRWQAFLLWISVAITLGGLASMGLFLGNLNLGSNVPFLLVGAIIGLGAGGIREIFTGNKQILEFRRASRLLLGIISALVLIGFLEYHLVYPDLISIRNGRIRLKTVEALYLRLNTERLLFHGAATGIFLVTIRRFVKYDAENGFFILGPPGSGKSLFLIGAYLEAKGTGGNGDVPLRPSGDLMDMIQKLDQSNTDWIVEATGQGEVQDLQFQYVHGSVFPVNLQVSTLDYAGEYLSQIPDAMTGTLSDEMTDEVLDRLRAAIEEADTLVMVIDVERYAEEDQSLDIQAYYSILQATSNKDVMLVATKADILAEEFTRDRGIEPHRYYDEFAEYVNQRLRQSENVDTLVRESGGETIIPVYYQTRVTDDGRRVPLRDESGSVVTVGFDRVLERFGA